MTDVKFTTCTSKSERTKTDLQTMLTVCHTTNLPHGFRDRMDTRAASVCQTGWFPKLFTGSILTKTPIGIGRIRHFLNENLKENGGHIGYAIAAPYQELGYGHELLRLLLCECNTLGISVVQLRANADNLPSNRIILRNGGVLVRKVQDKIIYHIAL